MVVSFMVFLFFFLTLCLFDSLSLYGGVGEGFSLSLCLFEPLCLRREPEKISLLENEISLPQIEISLLQI